MKQQIVEPGQGPDYDWAKDHIFVKSALDWTNGRVTVVEDMLKSGFYLARHHHRVMTEIFYILAGEVQFEFDDETVVCKPGTTVNIPPSVWHAVRCPAGGKLITIFSPGGFDQYLAELAAMNAEQLANEEYMTTVAERYDTWVR